MTPLEQELRDRTGVDALVGTKIKTTEEGKGLLAEIMMHAKTLMAEMAEKDLNNEEFKAYNDVRYDLKTAKHRIGSQLTALVRAKR